MHKASLVLVILLFASALTYAQVVADVSNSPVVESQSSTAAKNAPAVSFGAEGLLFSTHDNAYQLRMHGYVQADDLMFSNNVHGEELDTFFFRRIRPLFEGTLANAIDFRFMPDFGRNNPQIQEAYIEFKSLPFAKLRIGKFKAPIGLEVLQQDRVTTFTERSLASDLLPLRYMGAQVSGAVISNTITYAAGYFNGSNDGSNGNFQWIQANEAAARLFFHPFATTGVKAIRQFGIGVAGSAGDHHGPLAGLKTIAQSTFFKYSSTALANGQHNRLSGQAYYYVGPFGVMSEQVISSQDVRNSGVTRRLKNEAWEVTGSVVLTGEKTSYTGIRPRRSFEPNKGLSHLGALEFAVRYSQVRIDGDTFPLFANPKTAAREAKELGIGMNWYLNRYTKLVTDYEHTTFRMALNSVTPLHDEDVLMSRIQLAF
jgi:phosphate-selective porin OprO/OprP